MTAGQSIFIIALTVANIAGCVWLLWWTRRSPGEGATTEHTTGHVWDEDIRELNNPLPRWWLWLFIITVVFGVVYLALYPGLGTFKGTLNWTSRTEHAGESRLNAERIERTLAPFSARGAAELTSDPAALNIGRNLFLNNCATCHGSDGGGAPGFPNLADKDWLWGGDADTVVATIANGRTGIMPPWGGVLGARGVEDMLSYVMGLSGRKLEAGDPRAGAVKYARVVRCLPWARRAWQCGARGAQSHRWRVAARRLADRGARQHRKGTQWRHAGACRAARRDARQTTGGLRAVARTAGVAVGRQRGQRR